MERLTNSTAGVLVVDVDVLADGLPPLSSSSWETPENSTRAIVQTRLIAISIASLGPRRP